MSAGPAPAAEGSATDELPWWKRGAIYQIYPRSFADSDGNGVGDLEGIRSHLDHVASLGVEAIWLSPVFRSPMADFGYDVSDFCDIDPTFGTLADFDRLVADAHARGIRIVLDWVPNHTSEEHPWFLESRSSRENPKRDWYVWADPAPGGGPPNDWMSAFAAIGSAWSWDESTGQYYLHSFAPAQPDLNWDNPQVEAAMQDTARFWLDRGADGLRVDSVTKISKDPQLRDALGAPTTRHEDWETIHERLARLKAVLMEYPDRMLVGELWIKDLPRFASYLTGTGMDLAHNFEFVDLPWDAAAYRDFIDRFSAETTHILTAWPCWFLENHDLPRVVSRFDDAGLGSARARAILLMVQSLRGTPFIYQGQELGLPNADIPPERVVDLAGRDPGRAPIPWQRPSQVGPGSGFTTGQPWLPLAEHAEDLCVQAQELDPQSTLHLARRIATLRRDTPTLQAGAQRTLDAGPGVLAWLREDDAASYLVAISFGMEPADAMLPSDIPAVGLLVLSTDPVRADAGRLGNDLTDPDRSGTSQPRTVPIDVGQLRLAPGEGVLIRLLPGP